MRYLALTIALLLPFGARAQGELLVPEPFVQSSPPPRNYNDAFIGAGFGQFTRALDQYTQMGFAWTGRITFNSELYRYFGVELDYHGLWSKVEEVTLPNGANTGGTSITMHGIGLNGKFTLPLRTSARTRLEPYLFGGVGYAHFTTAVLFSVDDTKVDNAAAFPVGGGVSFVFPNGIVLDGRYSYSFITGARASNILTGNMWHTVFSLGYRVYSRL